MSPIKSKAQLARLSQLVKEGKISQAEFDKSLKETPDVKNLPDRANNKLNKVRKVKAI